MIIGPQTPAIVAGGASGLGAAVAAHLAALGAPVGVIDLNAPEPAASARFAQADISNPSAVGAALADAAGGAGAGADLRQLRRDRARGEDGVARSGA